MAQKTATVQNMTFEAALEELQTIVKSLESGQTALDDSVAAYERGVALKSHCESKLREARSKIEKISIDSNGAVSTAPFSAQE